MKKELQDLAWKSAPKEFREQVKKMVSDKENYTHQQRFAIRLLYGDENLFSDTEPEEMLMVERNKVQELYTAFEIRQAESSPNEDSEFWRGNKSGLKYLFGDKCLPDKEESVQVESKFHKGDKVLDLILADICTIENYNAKTDRYQLRTDAGSMIFRDEKDLEPYTEPEAKDNTNEIDEALYGKDMVSPKDEEDIEEMDAYDQYREAKEKEAMEEKELNLCELLKGCEGEKFFSLMFGDVTFVKVIEEPNLGFGEKPIATSEGRYLPNAMYGLDGVPTLFPSKELYEKHPLDAKAAWMEWQEARKPKRWTPQIGEHIFWVNSHGMVSQDVCRSDIEGNGHQLKRRAIGNEFKTGKEAQQAAEGIREYLKSFHEKNYQQTCTTEK